MYHELDDGMHEDHDALDELSLQVAREECQVMEALRSIDARVHDQIVIGRGSAYAY